ncbi:NAD-dependent epimerase/dehydratase family protein [Wohlfahrtiimonas larvae]|uniref:NAD-dependent epimerase/dehydratase family protein n=1 Tax=Wohlfahrtiimonas larvae TaxID=1157986 RepID=A0ABP9MYI7_9GAMM|nr:NAD-dependent epimerase/dehydratase family protein [Wohlfahrtiimonas larvae]
MTETILITGASGFLGKRIVRFLQRTSDVYLLTTSRQQESYPNHLVRDLSEVTPELTEKVDTVIHFAGLSAHKNACDEEFYKVNVNNTIQVAKAALASGVKRFIFISTTDVYDIDNHSTISEDSPLKPRSTYAKSKLAAEDALKGLCDGNTMNLIILRLPLIYHIDAVNEFGRYVHIVKENKPLPLDRINNQRTLLALCNFESALNAILRQPEICNETMIIADHFSMSTTQMIKGIAVAAVTTIKLFYAPKFLAKTTMKLTGKTMFFEALWGNYQVSSQYAQKRLKWQPSDDYVVNLSN